MKIAGQEIVGPLEDVLVLPRPGGKDVVFKAKAVMDLAEFTKLCPLPQAPFAYKRINGEMQKIPNINDKVFQAQLMEWSTKRASWLTLKALEPSQIEWETVDMSNPDTWTGYEKELRKYFADMEVFRIIGLASTVNGFNDMVMAEARERFLSEANQPSNGQSFQRDVPLTTPNGEQPSDSTSDHPVTSTSEPGTS
jgi:hypothetical protein